MKSLPEPKAELLACIQATTLIKITCASLDARAWASREAERFGTVFVDRKSISLFVSDLYNTDEVVAYLNSYNDKRG